MEYFLKHKLRRPKVDYATLPLRLGDICENPKIYKASKAFYADIYQKILNSRVKEIKGVYIVTAMHFGANEKNNKYFFSEEAKRRCIMLFRHVVEQLESLKCPIKIISHKNVDVDICFIARSEYLLPSLSKMTDLIFSAQKSTMKNLLGRKLFVNHKTLVDQNITNN